MTDRAGQERSGRNRASDRVTSPDPCFLRLHLHQPVLPYIVSRGRSEETDLSLRRDDLATPIGHALAGIAVASLLRPAWNRVGVTGISAGISSDSGPIGFFSRWAPYMVAGFFSVAPDLDFLPGILMGKPALYHQGITHSIAFALCAGLIAGSLPITGIARRHMFALAAFGWISHLAMDLVGPDGRLPYGIPLFWPISSEPFLSPIQLLMGVSHVASTHDSTSMWISSVISARNALALAIEIVWTVPLIVLARWFDRRQV